MHFDLVSFVLGFIAGAVVILVLVATALRRVTMI